MSETSAKARRWGVEMHDGSFEWYDARDLALSMVTRRSGLEPTGRIVIRDITTTIDDQEFVGSPDITGCGAWDGEPGIGHCCSLPISHSGNHHADHFWPAAPASADDAGRA